MEHQIEGEFGEDQIGFRKDIGKREAMLTRLTG